MKTTIDLIILTSEEKCNLLLDGMIDHKEKLDFRVLSLTKQITKHTEDKKHLEQKLVAVKLKIKYMTELMNELPAEELDNELISDCNHYQLDQFHMERKIEQLCESTLIEKQFQLNQSLEQVKSTNTFINEIISRKSLISEQQIQTK